MTSNAGCNKGPNVVNMTDDNITENVNIVNSQSNNARLQFIMHRLVTHLHDFARETRLTTDEWMQGIEFLTKVGQTCTDTRQEFILLSDTLGLSVLVDGMSHPKPENATVGTLLGPFHTHDAAQVEHGDSIASEGKGQLCVIHGQLRDTEGNPIVGAKIDLWECDETGHYDTQYSDRDGPDMRGIVTTDKDGYFWVKAIKPVPYPIPHDGPVGQMLQKLNRHPWRPAHIHFRINKDGFDELITALYLKDDPYQNADAVFGVKDQLLTGVEPIQDKDVAKKFGVTVDDLIIRKDFVLITKKQSLDLFTQRSKEALAKLNVNATLVDGLPVADLD